jgi:Family of unknown function (DUF5996)
MSLPELRYADWRATKDTLHLYVQQVGKLKLTYAQPLNHWWHVTFAVDVRGLTTGRMRAGDVGFDISFDLIDHKVVVRTDRGDVESFSLHDGLSVAAFHERLFALLGRLGLDVTITPKPFGLPMSTPFAEDIEHASYDAESVERFRDALAWVDWTLREFAGWYCGKSSPVQLFWHSFDLALTRFSGRRVPARPDADGVTAEAYSHEVISFGFWPGDEQTKQAAFYSYTAPEPDGIAEHQLAAGAQWSDLYGGSMALLPYDELRTARDPRETLLAFLQSAYDAGTAAAGWPADELRSSWCPPMPLLLKGTR